MGILDKNEIRRPNGVTDPQLQSLSSFGSGFLASMMLRAARAVQKLAKLTQDRCQPWARGLPKASPQTIGFHRFPLIFIDFL